MESKIALQNSINKIISGFYDQNTEHLDNSFFKHEQFLLFGSSHHVLFCNHTDQNVRFEEVVTICCP